LFADDFDSISYASTFVFPHRPCNHALVVVDEEAGGRMGRLGALSNLVELHGCSYRVGCAAIDLELIVDRWELGSKVCLSGSVSQNLRRRDEAVVAIVGVVANPAKTTAQRRKIDLVSYKRSSGKSGSVPYLGDFSGCSALGDGLIRVNKMPADNV
jgi:hypothetical protein